jgi:hypothetical protein
MLRTLALALSQKARGKSELLTYIAICERRSEVNLSRIHVTLLWSEVNLSRIHVTLRRSRVVLD